MTKTQYKPTGFPPGRPRKGELRPLTINGVYQAKYREKMRQDPKWLLHQALYQQLRRLEYPESYKKIAKNYRIRSKIWSQSQIRVSGKGL